MKTKPATDRPNPAYLKSYLLCNLDNDEQDSRKTEEKTNSCDEETPLERYIITEKRRKIRTEEIRDSAITRKNT